MTSPGSNARRELAEGPDVIAKTANLDVAPLREAIDAANRTTLIGCGSSYWTATMAASVLRNAGYDVEALYSSEFVLGNHHVPELVVGFSQSGETTETVWALDYAAEDATIGAVVNTRDSTMAERASVSAVTPAGDEEAVLATKSVDAALSVAYLLAEEADLGRVAERCRRVIDMDIEPAVDYLTDTDQTYTLGIGDGYGLAGEAATKLGEGPLIHSTPLPALEINHGPISNVSGTPVILLETDPEVSEIYTNVVGDLRDREAIPVIIGPNADQFDAAAALTVPDSVETLLPPLKVIQRLAVETAIARGNDPDSPPGLSKHVERDDI